MKTTYFAGISLSLCLLLSPHPVKGQVGAPYIHDPSTIAKCEGHYYTFGTGGGGLVSEGGWPVAGRQLKAGQYQILSQRRGYSLELAVDFVRIQQERQAFWRIDPNQPVEPISDQQLADVVGTWPQGDIAVRTSDYMMRPHQHWTIEPVAEAGGYLGGPYCKIVIAGTDRALAATAQYELTTVPAFTGADEQLWRIEQLTDGTYRLMPKHIPGTDGLNTCYCLYSAGDSTPTLAKYDFNSDNSKWKLEGYRPCKSW